ncbi:MAG: hypothetical protein ACR2OA_10145 [Rubripirellula sp.]
MSACQSLPAVLIVLATVTSPLDGTWTQAQDATPVEEASSSTQAVRVQDTVPVEEVKPDKTSEVAEANPFVPATTPPPEPAPPAQPMTSSDLIQSPAVMPEEIVTPIAEEVVIPTGPTAVVRVPAAPPEVFFDSPAPSQSDRRISQEKVAELRQQRALYRANQRMARMEYNQWMGREPLRPRWSPMPMMNSRYAPPTILVPVFINPR